MAYTCFNCSKKTIKGTQHRHHPGVAGRQHLRKAPHTPRSFLPNLHTAYLIDDGSFRRVKLCSKCRRLLKKQGKIRTWKKPEEKKQITLAATEVKQAAVTPEEAKPTVSVEELVGKKEKPEEIE